MRAPDLENGYMINTFEGYNRFQTYVEAALVRRRADDTWVTAYLSSRCRPEAISPDSIFNGSLYTFGILHTDEGTFNIHMGSSQVSRNPFAAAAAPYLKPAAYTSHVECAEVAVREVPFDEALADIQRLGAGKDNRLHMALEWQAGGETVTLYTDCRYTNFPNPELDHAGLWRDKPNYPRHEPRYLQPICGPVPFHDGARYHLGYVAAHVTAAGAQRVEFSLRDTISFFALRRPLPGWRGRLSMWLAASPVGRYFALSEYHRVTAVPASCRFYRYQDRGAA